MREEHTSRSQPRPYRQGAVPQRSPIRGFPSIYDAELPNLTW